jgi:hypothetical protein
MKLRSLQIILCLLVGLETWKSNTCKCYILALETRSICSPQSSNTIDTRIDINPVKTALQKLDDKTCQPSEK